MRCDRCGKTITEQTALIYHGSCVPCHRQRAAQRLARTVRGTWTRIRDLITVPFQIMYGIPGLLRLRFAQLPVSRREVLKTLEPVFGCSGAQLYFSALRHGYVRPGYYLSGRHPCYSLGLHDGLRSCSRRVVLARATPESCFQFDQSRLTLALHEACAGGEPILMRSFISVPVAELWP
jgi:hypothetical protein